MIRPVRRPYSGGRPWFPAPPFRKPDQMTALRFVLGDQLHPAISSLRGLADGDVVLLVEAVEECTYVRHHQKKIAFILSAMRHFAEALRARGATLDYVSLDDPDNRGSLTEELIRAVERHRPERVVVTEPGEYRVLAAMETWPARLGLPLEIRRDTRFLASREDFAAWAEGRKSLRMEHFYRVMRRRSGLLMAPDGQPVGGRWNFDRENRKRIPRGLDPPAPHRVPPDAITSEVLETVAARFGDHFGDLEPFDYAVEQAGAEAALETFIEARLPSFGDYQDAMRVGDDTLFHAVIGLYLNIGLLDPLAVCRRAEAAYLAGHAPLNAVEGFIRQILGWREYVRGIYWLKMPDYAEANALAADRPLPDFFWTAETDMTCLAESIGQTKRLAYAHHIQRLMVTGTFALLAGIDPVAVNEWYLIVYADAYEWVELPNVTGMALYADGGLLASKPYAASGKYIDRMSDYCKHCRYDVRETVGDDACPFNALYWNFLIENRDRLAGNPRMGMPYRNLARMPADKIAAIRTRASELRKSLH